MAAAWSLRTLPVLTAFALGAALGCADHGAPPAFTPDDLSQCEVQMPCGQVNDFPQGPGHEEPTEYSESQLCAFDSLAAGGVQMIHYISGCEGSCYGEAFLLRHDGTALRQEYYEDQGGVDAVEFDGFTVNFEDWEMAELCVLKDASYFQDCIDTFDASCVRPGNWVTDCAAPSVPSCGE